MTDSTIALIERLKEFAKAALPDLDDDTGNRYSLPYQAATHITILSQHLEEAKARADLADEDAARLAQYWRAEIGLREAAEERVKLVEASRDFYAKMCGERMEELDTAIRERDEARKALEWRPINTAPKDGTAILAFNCRHMTHAPVVVVWKADPDVDMVGPEPHWADAATRSGTALYYNSNFFSHWMPLPEAPI